MPFEANGIILSSFSFACGFSNDVTRAQRVLNQAVNMEPGNNGIYVMMRNLYAMEERWKDVKEINGLMRRRGAKKEVGSSAIEVDSRVSEFISGGIAHPQLDVIESVIGQLWIHMRDSVVAQTP
jgi:palmitoyl-protein thioesterase